MVKPDLSQETYTNQLWIYEGFTSFYDDVTLARAGVIALLEPALSNHRNTLILLHKISVDFYKTLGALNKVQQKVASTHGQSFISKMRALLTISLVTTPRVAL